MKYDSVAHCTNTPDIDSYDSRGFTARRTVFNRQAAEALIAMPTRHCWNQAGRLVASYDPRHEPGQVGPNLAYAYSLNGRLIRRDSVDAGWTLHVPGAAGKTHSSIDARGTRTRHEHDEILRPVAQHEAMKDAPWRCVERLSYGHSKHADRSLRNRLMRHDDTAGTLELAAYDIAGRVSDQTRRFIAAIGSDIDWPIAPDGRETLVDPTPYRTRQRRNALGELLWQIDAMGNRSRFVHSASSQLRASYLTLRGQDELCALQTTALNARGKPLHQRLGNGIEKTYRYEQSHGRLYAARSVDGDRRVLQELSYDYDPVGNPLRVTDSASVQQWFSNATVDPESTYRYDALYQLIEATGRERLGINQDGGNSDSRGIAPAASGDNPCVVGNYRQRYQYDVGGNLVSLRHAGSRTWRVDLEICAQSNRGCLAGQRTGREQLTFDACGNQRALQGGLALTWNGRNQLHRVVLAVREDSEARDNDSECYGYDGLGRRTVKVRTLYAHDACRVDQVRYLPDLEIRTASVNAKIRETILVVRSASLEVVVPLGSEPSSTAIYRYGGTDHLGSIALETDQLGKMVSREEYYPYGGTSIWAPRSATAASYKYRRFCGKERDASGLYYFGFRYYMPGLGRWLSANPAGAVDGLNLYAYVGARVMKLVDRSGLAGQDSSGAVEDRPLYADLRRDFRKGDIVYGLKEPRQDALRAVSESGFSRFGAATLLQRMTSWILKLEGRPSTVSNIRVQNDITNAVWDSEKPRVYEKTVDMFLSTNDFRRVRAFKSFIKSHEKFDVKNFPPQAEGEYTTEYVWKRLSKAGLLFQIEARKRTVHFVLDQVDFNAVVTKAVSPKSGKPLITNAELRLLYRLKDVPAMQQRVVFHRARGIVPHSEFINSMSNYQPRRFTSVR